jgi:hypothetical protein
MKKMKTREREKISFYFGAMADAQSPPRPNYWCHKCSDTIFVPGAEDDVSQQNPQKRKKKRNKESAEKEERLARVHKGVVNGRVGVVAIRVALIPLR